MNFVIFDLETTGLSPNYHEILQIAGVHICGGRLLPEETFSTYVRPQRAIPGMISEITGIRDEDVAGAPDAVEGLAMFSRFAGEATLVAHNGARFDMRFIRAVCVRHRLPMREVAFVDSLAVARSLWGYGGPHNLDALAERLGISTEGRCRHDALGDVQILADVFLRMLKLKGEVAEREGWNPSTWSFRDDGHGTGDFLSAQSLRAVRVRSVDSGGEGAFSVANRGAAEGRFLRGGYAPTVLFRVLRSDGHGGERCSQPREQHCGGARRGAPNAAPLPRRRGGHLGVVYAAG